ncbi:MAG: LysR family transcriptional regulator [Acidimicrobiales bacterium]
MDVRDLRVFLCIVEEGSVSAAARHLHVAQSGVSETVARLERELQARLLERSHNGSTPTSQGAVLLHWARRLVNSAERAREEVRSTTDGSVERLRVGFPTIASPLVLPGFLAGLRDRRAPVVVKAAEGLVPPLLEQVRDGSLDLTVMFFPSEEVRGVRFVEVAEWRESVLIPSDHELAGRSTVTMAELAPHAWVTFPPHNAGRLWLDTACAAAGFVPRIAAEVASPLQERIFIDAGLGIGLVPTGVPVDPAAPNVVEVHLEGVLPRFRVGYGYAPELAGPGTDVAREVLESVLNRLQADVVERGSDAARAGQQART